MRPIVAAMVLGLLATACGGGSGASFGGGISGSGKPAVRVGALEQDGAVVVGGLSFEASEAVVTVSGTATPLADLRKGMVALVTGTIDETTGLATAESVQIEAVVKGPITAKLDAVTFTVLGQTIEITPDTVFEDDIVPASLDGLLVNDPVEVYGFVKPGGMISAARIELEDSLDELVLVGVIANLDTNAETFDIGTQTVDYGNADTSELPGGTPANDLVVEVEGAPMLNGMGQVAAISVEPLDDGPDDVDDVEMEGFVTNVVSATEFDLGTQRVRTDGSTSFDGGTASDVVVGVGLEVAGRLESGILIADEVNFGEDVEIESDVDTVVGTDITLVGFPGLTVSVNASTDFDGDAANLGDVMPGDHVRIRGRVGGPTTITATRVEETSADTDVELRGPVDVVPAPSDPTVSVLGISVDTTGLDDDDFESDEVTIGRAAFFAGATAGTLVAFQGTLSGVTVTWDEAELEADD